MNWFALTIWMGCLAFVTLFWGGMLWLVTG